MDELSWKGGYLIFVYILEENKFDKVILILKVDLKYYYIIEKGVNVFYGIIFLMSICLGVVEEVL